MTAGADPLVAAGSRRVVTTGADGQPIGTEMFADTHHTGDRRLTEDTRDFVAVLARTG